MAKNKKKLQGGAHSFFQQLAEACPELLKTSSIKLLNVTESNNLMQPYALRMDGLYNTKYFFFIDWLINRRFKDKIKNADRLIFQSSFAENLFRKKFSSLLQNKSFCIIPNGCKRHDIINKSIEREVVIIGRVGYMHNVPLVLEIVKKFDGNVSFFIAPRSTFFEKYTSFYRRLLKKLTKLNVTVYLDKPTDYILQHLSSRRCIVLYLSHFAGDACPNTVIESLSTGTPVMTLDKGPAQHITDGTWSLASNLTEQDVYQQNLFFTPTIDSHYCLAKLKIIFENYDIHQESALEIWRKKFDISNISKAYREFLIDDL